VKVGKVMIGGAQRQIVASCAQSADDPDGGQIGMVPERLAREHVGQMHFDERGTDSGRGVLGVALKTGQLVRLQLHVAVFDVGQGGGTVGAGLASTRQVQVWSIQQQQVGHEKSGAPCQSEGAILHELQGGVQRGNRLLPHRMSK